jgi:hypothetical protein
MLQMLYSRNADTANMLFSFLNELFQLSFDFMKPPTPLFAYAAPLLRLVVVLVIDLYEPLLTHLACSGSTQDSAFEELCGFTKSCCELLLQSVYIFEEFDIDSAHHVTSGSQICFIGAVLPFRVKQDHIGCVSLLKISQLIKKLSQQPSTRNIIQYLAAVVSGQPITAVLPHLLYHFPLQEASSCPQDPLIYTCHVYTEVLPRAYAVHGARAESTNDAILLWVKTFIHQLISFTDMKNEKICSPR